MFCHPAEVEGYARSAMAHSLRRAGQEPDGTVSAHGSKIAMHSTAAGYWQLWENGGDRTEYRVDYVIGSGTHASGYLVDIGGHLFQSPVAYYKSRQAYDLAPGYENQPDPDFTRPVSEECVLCHSGRALHVSGTLNEYRSPIFPAEAISCERCHGPVERHLANPRADTIVNPARLEPAARDSVCEQCHLFGVARVPNPGKEFSDFVPGQRLEDTFTIYRNAVPAGSSAGAFKVISHVEQLALSACARNSGERLWCGTCHDPHDKPVQAVQYYRARCLSCHTGNFAAPHPAKDSDCLGCHMPRRDAQDGGHTVFTDHRIQRRPAAQSDLPPETDITAWRQPSPELQRRNLGIARIDVGMQRHSSAFIIQGYRALTEVQQQFTKDSDFFKWIGDALLVGKQTSDAKIAFERALQLDPDSPLTEAGAASPYIQEGDADRAIAHLERAVTLDPLYLPAASTLIGLYQKQGKTAEADALANKIRAAMSEASAGERTTQDACTDDSQKEAEVVFKNIKVLKGVPACELIPAMEFISSSLGVQCSFCHVESDFEKDDKEPKQRARNMILMMFALNKNSFEGHREVTCYSCHRGSREPVATPVVAGDMPAITGAANPEIPKLPAGLPTAGQLISNYITALGGASAIEKITSLVEEGVTSFGGLSVKVEIFTQTPERQAIIRHLPAGESRTVFNGHTGWFTIPGRPARAMEPADMEAARMDADLQFPLHIQQSYPELRVEYPETIAGREAYPLFCIRQGRPPAKLYFDAQSGLLVRVVRYAESPLGSDPTQTDYADYRKVEDLQFPFRITSSQPGTSSTLAIKSIGQNVSIDDAIFAKPFASISKSASAPIKQ
jgi:photosynthetic reaction center cytochrome c subunit